MTTPSTTDEVRLYEEHGEELLSAADAAERVSLLPGAGGRIEPGQTIRCQAAEDQHPQHRPRHQDERVARGDGEIALLPGIGIVLQVDGTRRA